MRDYTTRGPDRDASSGPEGQASRAPDRPAARRRRARSQRQRRHTAPSCTQAQRALCRKGIELVLVLNHALYAFKLHN